MSARLCTATVLLAISYVSSAQNPNEPVGPVKPVEVVNDVLTIEGEVNATLDEPIEVEGVVGVDVLSVPDDAVDIEDFMTQDSFVAVRGDVPLLDYNLAFSGVLNELQVQLLVNGILLRDSGEASYFPIDIGCALKIYARKGAVERLIWRSDIIQSNDQGASGVTSLPNVDLRDGGTIRTRLELTSGGATYPSTPICFLNWVAKGTT